MSKPTPLEVAIAAIKAAPLLGKNRIHWAAVPDTMIKVAVAILSATDRNAAFSTLAQETGVNYWTAYNFIRGRDASNRMSDAIIAGIAAAGLKHDTIDRRNGKKVRDPIATTTATDPPVKAVAPVADPTPVKPATLAVTSKGEVVTATPPTAATTPTAMVAQGGDFAVKTATTRSAIDSNTGDILVITTRRVLYGSPEHRAKMIEMNAKKS